VRSHLELMRKGSLQRINKNCTISMTPDAQAILESWTAPIGLNVSLCLVALVYTAGWLRLRKVFPDLIPAWRLAAFSSGIVSLWIAVGSPLEAFDDVSLSAHMVQHLLLMAVAPPLILLGAPTLPLLRGLPRWMVRGAVGRFFRWPQAQRLGRVLTDPAVCWIAASMALIAWHIPAAFELALRSDSWHKIEHACFFVTSLMFWWLVIRPFPSAARWPRWSIPLYLFLGTLPGGALGAFLTFCDRVLYPSYASAPMVFHISHLDDQIFAGALMWVFGTFVYAVPAVILTVQLLSGQTVSRGNETTIHLRKLAGHSSEQSQPEVV
jgi:putative membrane protein